MYNEDDEVKSSFSVDDKILRKQNYSKKKFKKTELSDDFKQFSGVGKKKQKTGNITRFYSDFEED